MRKKSALSAVWVFTLFCLGCSSESPDGQSEVLATDDAESRVDDTVSEPQSPTGGDTEIDTGEGTGGMEPEDTGSQGLDTGGQGLDTDETPAGAMELPPPLSYFYELQRAALEAKRGACGVAQAPPVALPEGLAEHLTTRLEYEAHLACLEEIAQVPCDPAAAERVWDGLDRCLWAEPKRYDPLDPPLPCEHEVKKGTFAPHATEFNLYNAYWLLEMTQLALEDDSAVVKARMAAIGYEEAEVFRQNRLNAVIAEGEDHIIFTFRGTTDLIDYLGNATYVMSDSKKTGLPGRVHTGFYDTLESGWKAFEKRLVAASQTGKILIFNGHSLGGAQSQLAALRAHEKDIEIAFIYNFAVPRVGDEEYAAAFEALFDDRFYRINNGLDIAPHVPPSVAAEETAKKTVLELLGDAENPNPILMALAAALDFGLKFSDYTQAGDAYWFDRYGYFLGRVEERDVNDIYFWLDLRERWEGKNLVTELGNLPKYHSETLHACYQARIVHQLLYERPEVKTPNR